MMPTKKIALLALTVCLSTFISSCLEGGGTRPGEPIADAGVILAPNGVYFSAYPEAGTEEETSFCVEKVVLIEGSGPGASKTSLLSATKEYHVANPKTPTRLELEEEEIESSFDRVRVVVKPDCGDSSILLGDDESNKDFTLMFESDRFEVTENDLGNRLTLDISDLVDAFANQGIEAGCQVSSQCSTDPDKQKDFISTAK